MPVWGTGVAIASAVVVAVWFFTPLPTLAARYIWEEYRFAPLTLALDRADGRLALAIGNYYFGNQTAIGTANKRPYNLPLAKKAYDKALRIDPSLSLAHYMRARIEFVQSDFSAALEDLNAALTISPDNKRPLYFRGLTYVYRGHAGDLSLAEQDFRAFVAWAPTEWAGYNDLAFVLAKEKKYADAAAVLKEAIATAKGGAENPWLWVALGVMELNLDKPSLAVASLGKAQTFAESLTETDWQKAYPGNNPALAKEGIEALQTGIARNVLTVYAALEKE
ncbi:MAG: tetratricopeptide repeat protein [Minisyncoccia bacterium]